MRRYEPPSRHDELLEFERDEESVPFSDFGGPIQPPADGERKMLSALDVARYCGVPAEDVLGWIDTGRLVASYMRNGGYRIAIGDFTAFFSRYVFLV